MHKKILLNFFFLLSFLITNPLIAEDVLQEDTIANIIIKGNERVSDDTVLTYANISKGDRITPELIKNVIKRLYQTNYFDDISVTQNFNDLIIVLTEKPIVSSIIITDKGYEFITNHPKKINEVIL